MDKIWWNEQWMGWPLGPQYAASSNVDNAYQAARATCCSSSARWTPTWIPSSTLQVVNQLIKHDKNFDLLEIPGSNHTSGGPYGDHKRWDFFVQHLLGVTPPRWTELMKATEAQAASAAAADDDDNDPLKSPWVTEGSKQ